MTRVMIRSFSWGVPCLALLLCAAQAVQAQKSISFIKVTKDVTDYSDTGLDIGNAGFWFAQFDATAPITGAAVDDNDRNSLPAWLLPDFNPGVPCGANAGYSFSCDAGGVFSEGGDPLWNTLTLPDGTSGLSGSLVDPNTANNSNNTINDIRMGATTPQSFLMHVVVDNTNGEHDPANRIRARAESDDGLFDEDFRVNTAVGDFNGIADVYTFRYDGWDVDDFIKMQLNSGVPGEFAGFAGLMFDVVPEPSSAVLLLLGAVGCCSGLRRRSGR